MITAVATTGPSAPRRSNVVQQALLLAGRHLVESFRTPDVLLYTLVVPVVMVVLVDAAFGGALGPDGAYIQSLVPAMFVLAAGEVGFTTAAGTANDLNAGLVDRFRTLPISRAAMPIGRSLSDLLRLLSAFAAVSAVGSIMGFRFQTLRGGLVAVGLALAFGVAITWIAICLGAALRDAETASSAGLLVFVLPLFASSALVPVETMPSWLRVVAEHSPYTAVVDAMRAAIAGDPYAGALWRSLAWVAAVVLITVPLSARLFRGRP